MADKRINRNPIDQDGSFVLELNRATRMLIGKAYVQGVNDMAAGEVAQNSDDAVERVWASLLEPVDQ